ncbi:MAG: response regulator [Proteobacteria bacterium]|nr:response regulator [Pseudomonadota bacterium]MBU4010273.1 response regulator [Pseudomonadota bacterium]MBU4037845.1 response regulator [Pseudomonadota bacterium]
MLKLLLVVANKEDYSGFATELVKQKDVDLLWADSGEKALDMVSAGPVDLVITDEKLIDMNGLEFALRLLSVNPMVNCSAVSSLDAKEFHDKSEGLGLMSQLPPRPGAGDALELLAKLKKLKNLTECSALNSK